MNTGLRLGRVSSLSGRPEKKGIKRPKRIQARVSTAKEILSLAEHAADVICRFDRDSRLLYVNPAIEKATGIPAQTFLNKTTRELGMPEEHSQNWDDGIAFVLSKGKQTTLEFPFPHPSGGVRFYQALLVPEFSIDGSIETVLSISRDISEIKKEREGREEVVGFVSHELKTPVTSLKAFTQALQHRFVKQGDAHTAEFLGMMDGQIDKITRIIRDLLDTTQFSAGTIQLQKEGFDFNLLVREIAREIEAISPKYEISVRGKVKRNVIGDKLRIGQVLTNLLSNAVKNSSRPNRIIVHVVADLRKITCSVKDHGIGIPKNKLKKIFERFYRVEDRDRPPSEGLGLGLYISSQIIREHGGRMWAESAGVNKGSVFYFTLPFGRRDGKVVS